MKTLLYIIALQFVCTVCVGQNVAKDQLVREIEAFKADTYKAITQFLNPQLDLQSRINAAIKYPFIYDAQQVQKAKAIVLNNSESAQLRAVALSKIFVYVPDDETLGNSLIQWIQDTQTPKELRNETLNALSNLTFSGFATFSKRQELTAALRNVCRDPELRFRQFAFSFLMDHNDSFAQSLLVEQLEQSRTDLLPTVECLRLLALNPKGDYLPTAYKILQNPPNKESKVEAIILCGNYAPAKNTIISLLKDKKQPEDLRTVVLSTLNSNYPKEFASLVENMIIDPNEPEGLRATAIVMETLRRKSNQKRIIGDNFEKNVETLKNSPLPSIRKATDLYINDVKSRM